MFGKLMKPIQRNFNPEMGGGPQMGQGMPEMGEDQDWWQQMIGRGKGMGGLMKMALMQMRNPGASDKMSIPQVEDQMEGGWYGGSSGSNSYGSQLPSPRDYSDMGY